MDLADLAKKCVDRMFDRASEDGRVMHKDAMCDELAQELAKHLVKSPYGNAYIMMGDDSGWPPPVDPGVFYTVRAGDTELKIEPGKVYVADPVEVGLIGTFNGA